MTAPARLRAPSRAEVAAAGNRRLADVVAPGLAVLFNGLNAHYTVDTLAAAFASLREEVRAVAAATPAQDS